MNISNMDKIIMSSEDVDRLFLWRDNHKDYVRSFKSPITEGCIIFENFHNQVFIEEDGIINYTVYHGEKKVHQLTWNRLTGVGSSTFSMLKGINEHEYNKSVVSLHASLMAYMEYYSDKKEYVEVSKVSIERKKKLTKKGKKSNHITKIRKTIYKIKIDDKSVIRDKARYERHIERWSVRGHWRETKNGNKVWVKPHVRGQGSEIKSKTYKI
jgi:hypothetical protein